MGVLLGAAAFETGHLEYTDMNRKSLLDAALGLCTVGGAVFAVGASKDPVSKVVVLPDAAFGTLMVVGGILAAVGAIAFVLSFLIDRIEHAVSQVAYGDLDFKVFLHPSPPERSSRSIRLVRTIFWRRRARCPVDGDVGRKVRFGFYDCAKSCRSLWPANATGTGWLV